MKKTFAVLLAAMMLIALAACSDIPEETLIDPVETTLYPIDTTLGDHDCTTTGYYHDCTTTSENVFTSSRDDIAPLDHAVTLLDANGEELALYSELVYFIDGMVVGDGALVFMSVTSRLPAIADDIPLVSFSGIPMIKATAREGVSIRGGETVNVYGEDFSLLAENVTLSELWEKGNSDWDGKTVYIFFTVGFADETPNYEKRTEIGYFARWIVE